MKVEVVTSKKRSERLKASGVLKTAAVASIIGLGGLALSGSSVSAMNLSDLSIQVNPEYQQYMVDVAAGNGTNWTLIPSKYIYNKQGGKGSDAVLPASYNLVEAGYGTTLKNQGTDGDCWAFATATAIESNLKKTQGISTEVSPKQLDYLAASGSPYYDVLASGYYTVARNVADGGNFAIASFPLMGQYAPVSESGFFGKLQANDANLSSFTSWRQYADLASIYLISSYTKTMNSSLSMSGKSDYVVTEYKNYDSDADTVSEVKNDVYNYGAAYVGTTAPDVEGCWDADTDTIVDLGTGTCGSDNGHAMAIVGWDDNHAYTDPATGEAKNGAFLLQNSWGEDSLFEDYGFEDEESYIDGVKALYESNELGLSGEEETAYREYYNDRKGEAYDYIWLAYDSDTVDIASIREVRPNYFNNIYEPTNQADGLGGDTSEEEGIVYTYTTNGETEYIDSVAVASHMGFHLATLNEVYIDASGTGDNYEKVAEVNILESESEQKIIDLDDPIEVSGKFLVKLVVSVPEYDTVLDSDTQIGVDYDTGDAVLFEKFEPYFTVSVYTVDDTIEVPNTAGETSGVSSAPNTGWFTGENSFAKVGGILAMMVVMAAGLFGARVYKNRKHLFHKVGFDKK